MANEDPLQLEPQLVDAVRETIRETVSGAVSAPIHEAVRVAMAEAGHRQIDEVIGESITDSVTRYSHLVEGQIQMLAAQHQAEMKAMAEESKARMTQRKRTRGWTLLKPVVAGLVVVAVLAVAGWGLHQWSSIRFRTAVVALTATEERIAGARLRLDRLKEQMWGVALVASDGRCLVLLPEAADVETHLRFDGRRAAELPCPAGDSND